MIILENKGNKHKPIRYIVSDIRTFAIYIDGRISKHQTAISQNFIKFLKDEGFVESDLPDELKGLLLSPTP